MTNQQKRSKGTRVSTTLIPAQAALLDSMVGVFGKNRAEVLRFAFLSWSHNNIAAISELARRKVDFDRQKVAPLQAAK